MSNANYTYIICTANKYSKLESKTFNTKQDALQTIMNTLDLQDIRSILREELGGCVNGKYLNNKKSLAVKLIDKIPANLINKYDYI